MPPHDGDGFRMNLAALLSRHARYRPEHLAVVFEDQRLTFRQLDTRVNRLANALLAKGLVNGDKMRAGAA
jgi:non-ribosomal peptide synthetase component E (peptide arylation enzyme)